MEIKNERIIAKCIRFQVFERTHSVRWTPSTSDMHSDVAVTRNVIYRSETHVHAAYCRRMTLFPLLSLYILSRDAHKRSQIEWRSFRVERRDDRNIIWKEICFTTMCIPYALTHTTNQYNWAYRMRSPVCRDTKQLGRRIVCEQMILQNTYTPFWTLTIQKL